MDNNIIFIILDIIGIIAFTISGYIVSVRARYDLLGIIFISFVTAFGGGLIRDIIIGVKPFIFCNSYPTLVSFIIIIVFLVLMFKYCNTKHYNNLENNKLFVLADTIGLSTYSFIGSTTALAYNFNFSGVIFIGFVTAIGGSAIRDVIMNKEIYILKKDFYGSVAIIISLLVYVAHNLGNINLITTIIIISTGIILRLLAIKYKWYLKNVDF